MSIGQSPLGAQAIQVDLAGARGAGKPGGEEQSE
jgi:hypothetical protein